MYLFCKMQSELEISETQNQKDRVALQDIKATTLRPHNWLHFTDESSYR